MTPQTEIGSDGKELQLFTAVELLNSCLKNDRDIVEDNLRRQLVPAHLDFEKEAGQLALELSPAMKAAYARMFPEPFYHRIIPNYWKQQLSRNSETKFAMHMSNKARRIVQSDFNRRLFHDITELCWEYRKMPGLEEGRTSFFTRIVCAGVLREAFNHHLPSLFVARIDLDNLKFYNEWGDDIAGDALIICGLSCFYQFWSENYQGVSFPWNQEGGDDEIGLTTQHPTINDEEFNCQLNAYYAQEISSFASLAGRTHVFGHELRYTASNRWCTFSKDDVEEWRQRAARQGNPDFFDKPPTMTGTLAVFHLDRYTNSEDMNDHFFQDFIKGMGGTINRYKREKGVKR